MSDTKPRIVPPLYFLAAVGAMLLLHKFAPLAYWLGPPWRYVGVVPLLCGLLLTRSSGMRFRKAGTPLRPGEQAKVFVTEGAFRHTRNPMYLGMMVILIGLAILLGSVSPLFVMPVLYLILRYQFIWREEKWMESWFGESYVAYKSKTRRWI